MQQRRCREQGREAQGHVAVSVRPFPQHARPLYQHASPPTIQTCTLHISTCTHPRCHPQHHPPTHPSTLMVTMPESYLPSDLSWVMVASRVSW